MLKNYFSIVLYFSFFYILNIEYVKAQEPNYLILSPDILYNSATELKEYRESTNFTVEIINLKTISNSNPLTSEIIDTYIENYISNNNNLKYIVLLGNTELLPTYISISNYSDPAYSSRKDAFNSDLWYSVENDSLNSNYLPSVSVGRIPVSNSDEFSNYIEKVKNFENNGDKLNTILFYGNEAEMSYAINRDIEIAEQQGFNTVYLIDPSETELINILNSTSLKAVIYYGHGSYSSNFPLSTYNVVNWENVQSPVLFFSGGCNFNDSMNGLTSLGNTLVNSPTGAISSIGASINGGYGYDYYFIKEILSNINLYSTIGSLYNNVLQNYYDHVPDNSIGSWNYYFTRYMNYIGDPGLIINSGVVALSLSKEVIDSINIYPNPVSNTLSIDSNLPVERVEIYTILGQKVNEMNSDFNSISTNNLSRGIYLVHIYSEMGNTVRKLIKK